jgi:hypothetical protein
MSISDKLRRKKKNIEGNVIIDNPDIKVVTATYNGKPFVIGIGTTEERIIESEGSVNVKGGKGKYQSQKALKWKMLYDPEIFPKMVPLDNLKAVAASTIAVTSESKEAFNGEFERKTFKNIKKTTIKKELSKFKDNVKKDLENKAAQIDAQSQRQKIAEQINNEVYQLFNQLNNTRSEQRTPESNT